MWHSLDAFLKPKSTAHPVEFFLERSLPSTSRYLPARDGFGPPGQAGGYRHWANRCVLTFHQPNMLGKSLNFTAPTHEAPSRHASHFHDVGYPCRSETDRSCNLWHTPSSGWCRHSRLHSAVRTPMDIRDTVCFPWNSEAGRNLLGPFGTST